MDPWTVREEELESVWFRASVTSLVIFTRRGEGNSSFSRERGKAVWPFWSRMSSPFLLEEREPILLTTALEQFQKFRRGDPELLLSLQPLLEHPDPGIREGAARLAGQILARYPSGEVTEEASLRSELISRARRDPEIDVRVAATGALSRFDDPAVEDVLEEISDNDPDQRVRYAAEKLLHERRKARRASASERER